MCVQSPSRLCRSMQVASFTHVNKAWLGRAPWRQVHWAKTRLWFIANKMTRVINCTFTQNESNYVGQSSLYLKHSSILISRFFASFLLKHLGLSSSHSNPGGWTQAYSYLHCNTRASEVSQCNLTFRKHCSISNRPVWRSLGLMLRRESAISCLLLNTITYVTDIQHQ